MRGWFCSWVVEEEDRMLSHRVPLKKSLHAEEYELDPERAVSFADIEGALVRLVMPKSRADVVKLLLRHVRVPIHPQSASQVESRREGGREGWMEGGRQAGRQGCAERVPPPPLPPTLPPFLPACLRPHTHKFLCVCVRESVCVREFM